MHDNLPVQFKLTGGVSWEDFTKTPSCDDAAYEFDTIYFEHLGRPRAKKYWHQLCPEKFAAIRAVLKESRGVHVELNCAFPKHQQLIRTVLDSIRKLHIIRYNESYYDLGCAITSKELMLNCKFLDFLLKATWMPNFTTLVLEPNTNGNLSYEETFNQLLDSCVTSGQLQRYQLDEDFKWKLCKDLHKKQIITDGKSEEGDSIYYNILLSCLAD